MAPLSPAALLELPAPERHAAKRFYLARNASRGFFEREKFRAELRDLRESGPVLECFFCADSLGTGRPVALGANRVRVERIILPNPPAKVPDGRGDFLFDPEAALREVLSQTLGLLAKEGEPDSLDSVGRTTLVVYPDAGSGGTTCDGRVRNTGNELSWATIRTQQAAFADLSGSLIGPHAHGDTVSDTYDQLYREFLHFDTSFLGPSALVSTVTYSIRGTGKTSGLGETPLHVVQSTAASSNNLVANDFGQVGSLSFASVAYSSYSTTGYNNIALNAAGIANISKSGVSKFAERLGFDLDNTPPTWATGASSNLIHRAADNTGTTEDPKLTIEYTAPSFRNFAPVLFNGRR